MIDYPLDEVLWLGLLMFIFRYPSVNLFYNDFLNKKTSIKNLESFFGIHFVPTDDAFRYALKKIPLSAINELLRKINHRLERQKILKPFLLMKEKYLVAMDGTGQYSSYKIKSKNSIQKKIDGEILYQRQVLNAAFIGNNGDLSLCMGFEPISNIGKDKYDKNDCEIEAAKRLFKRLKQMYPKRKLCINGDALYSVKPIFLDILKNGWSCIFTAKPDRNKELFRWVDYLKGDNGKVHSYTDLSGHRHEYMWINAVPLKQEYHEDDYFYVNFLEYTEFDETGKKIFHSTWITDISISYLNIVELARAGRARFTGIENRSFNEQKNNGFGLTHNYGHAENLPDVFYGLIQIAHIISQLFFLWKTGKQLLHESTRHRERFCTSLATLMANTLMYPSLFPILYLKFEWNTS
jgi:hypothetical protein